MAKKEQKAEEERQIKFSKYVEERKKKAKDAVEKIYESVKKEGVASFDTITQAIDKSIATVEDLKNKIKGIEDDIL